MSQYQKGCKHNIFDIAKHQNVLFKQKQITSQNYIKLFMLWLVSHSIFAQQLARPVSGRYYNYYNQVPFCISL